MDRGSKISVIFKSASLRRNAGAARGRGGGRPSRHWRDDVAMEERRRQMLGGANAVPPDLGEEANKDFDVKFVQDTATLRAVDAFLSWVVDVNCCREAELDSGFLLFGRPLPGRGGSDERAKGLAAPKRKSRDSSGKFIGGWEYSARIRSLRDNFVAVAVPREWNAHDDVPPHGFVVRQPAPTLIWAHRLLSHPFDTDLRAVRPYELAIWCAVHVLHLQNVVAHFVHCLKKGRL